MSDPPGRDTRRARSNSRRTWYGLGQSASIEKNWFGRWLDDVAYAFAEVSILGLPALWVVMQSTDLGAFGLKATALVAWTTMVLGAATIRSGFLTPLGTDVRGWVTLSPSLILFRLVYYNAALAIASYWSVWIARAVSIEIASIAIAFLLAALTVGAFPWLAEAFYRRVLDWRSTSGDAVRR